MCYFNIGYKKDKTPLEFYYNGWNFNYTDIAHAEQACFNGNDECRKCAIDYLLEEID